MSRPICKGCGVFPVVVDVDGLLSCARCELDWMREIARGQGTPEGDAIADRIDAHLRATERAA